MQPFQNKCVTKHEVLCACCEHVSLNFAVKKANKMRLWIRCLDKTALKPSRHNQQCLHMVTKIDKVQDKNC